MAVYCSSEVSIMYGEVLWSFMSVLYMLYILYMLDIMYSEVLWSFTSVLYCEVLWSTVELYECALPGRLPQLPLGMGGGSAQGSMLSLSAATQIHFQEKLE